MPITQIPLWLIYLVAFSQLTLAIAFLIIAFALLPGFKSLIAVSKSCDQVAEKSSQVVRNSNATLAAFTRKVEPADPRDMAVLAAELGKSNGRQKTPRHQPRPKASFDFSGS